MVSFGEVVMCKLATDKTRRHKLESEWDRGIVVGMSGRSREMLIATDEDVFKCRTVRRVPREHMADPTCLDQIEVSVTEYLKRGARTTSSKPKAIGPMPAAPEVEGPETRRKEMAPRRVRLTNE